MKKIAIAADHAGFELKEYFNLFKTDPRQPFRYLKLKINHPTFKPNGILQNFLGKIKWKEYFNCCLRLLAPRTIRKNNGRIATSLESLFENFGLVDVLKLMGSEGLLFEGLTDIPFAKVASTLNTLDAYAHQAHYTETGSEYDVYRLRKIQAYRQRMAFNFFVTTHYRFQEDASHVANTLEKFQQWKLSQFVKILGYTEKPLLEFILNRLYELPSSVIVNDPSIIVMMATIQIEYLKQHQSRYGFHPQPAISYPAEGEQRGANYQR